MITCDRCGRENQDHYKFCLGCGAELPRDAAKKPKAVRAPTPPGGVPAADIPAVQPPAAPVPEPAVPAPAVAAAPEAGASDEVPCPQCGTMNPASFQFCGACGLSLKGNVPAPAPVASAANPAPAPSAEGATIGKLVVIRPDGSQGEAIPLQDGATIGRDTGGSLASDAYLSPRHATFRLASGGELLIRDEASLNGVYWRLAPETPHPLDDGTIFRIGQEIIRFETLPSARAEGGVDLMGSPNEGFLGRISLIVGLDTSGNSFCIPKEGMHLGRERGDIIFPDDGYVSGLHCRIHGENGQVVLTDAGSSNGTFIRIQGEHSLSEGGLILMGQQLFRIEL